MVTAKFTVQRIERTQDWSSKKELQTIVLTPVTGGSEENSKFFAYTPSGEVRLGTVNAEAASMFELGKSYYIDFRKAE